MFEKGIDLGSNCQWLLAYKKGNNHIMCHLLEEHNTTQSNLMENKSKSKEN